jgi:hypothetical protein
MAWQAIRCAARLFRPDRQQLCRTWANSQASVLFQYINLCDLTVDICFNQIPVQFSTAAAAKTVSFNNHVGLRTEKYIQNFG